MGGRSREETHHNRLRVVGGLHEPVLSRTINTSLLRNGAQFTPTDFIHRARELSAEISSTEEVLARKLSYSQTYMAPEVHGEAQRLMEQIALVVRCNQGIQQKAPAALGLVDGRVDSSSGGSAGANGEVITKEDANEMSRRLANVVRAAHEVKGSIEPEVLLRPGGDVADGRLAWVRGRVYPPAIAEGLAGLGDGFTLTTLLDPPDFTVLEMDLSLAFIEEDADRAHISANMELRANRDGLREFWIGPIAPDGVLQNLLVNGVKPGPEHRRTSVGGIAHVLVDLGEDLKRGQRRTVPYSFDVVDSFPDNRSEFWQYSVGFRTKKVKMKVRFLEAKRCMVARMKVGYGGIIRETLDAPELKTDGLELVAEATNPKVGAQYRLEWDW